MEGARPIIIVKKKAGHGGHHGGAWKVAYADFVTAMMALFIVLWLLNSSKKIQEAVGGYFRDPMGSAKNAGSNMAGTGVSLPISKDDMPKLKEELEKRIRQMSNFDKLKNQIEITMTPEGLRIELIETENGTFFNLGSAATHGERKATAIPAGQRVGQASQPSLHRRPHRCQALSPGNPATAIGSSPPTAPTPRAG